MSNQLLNKVVSGVKWTTLATVLTAVLQIGYTSIMARLLNSEIYGLFALAGVLLRFGTYFAGMGLGQALIQKNEIDQNDIRSAFTSSFSLGIFFFITVYTLAPFSTLILSENDQIVSVLRMMSITFLIGGLASTSNNILRRQMRFYTISIITTISYIVSYCVIGLTLAFLDYGVWSLVVASLTNEAIICIWAYSIVKHNVKPIFNWKHYKPLFAFGSKISVISFLQYIGSNFERIIIGRLFNASLLGVYDRAYNIINLPAFHLTNSLTKILFPSFSKLQNNLSKLAKAYTSFITLLTAILFPICMGIFAASDQVVWLLLGEGWEQAIPILEILCFAIPLSFTTKFAGIVCDATANLNKKLLITLFYIVIICSLIFLFKDMGLTGLATAIVIGELIKAFLYFKLMNDILKLKLSEILKAYIPGALNGAIIACSIHGITILSNQIHTSQALTLTSQILTGFILLVILTFFLSHKSLAQNIYFLLCRLNVTGNHFTVKIFTNYKNYLGKRHR